MAASRRGLAARWQLAEWAVPLSRADKPGRTFGSETDHTTQGSSTGK